MYMYTNVMYMYTNVMYMYTNIIFHCTLAYMYMYFVQYISIILNVYSGTPIIWTPLGPGSSVLINRVSLFQGLALLNTYTTCHNKVAFPLPLDCSLTMEN